MFLGHCDLIACRVIETFDHETIRYLRALKAIRHGGQSQSHPVVEHADLAMIGRTMSSNISERRVRRNVVTDWFWPIAPIR